MTILLVLIFLQNQIEKEAKCLSESGYAAKLICGAMEDECGLPNGFTFISQQ